MLAWRYLISASIGENLRYRSLSAAESEAGISEKQHRMEVCTVDDFREWLSDNLRYILLGLAIIIVLVIAFFAVRFVSDRLGDSSDNGQTEAVTEAPASETTAASETEAATEAESTAADSSAALQTDNAAVQEAVTQYYNAVAAKDFDALQTLGDVVGDTDKDKINSNPIESYNNISVYYKQGLTDGSYNVYVYYEAKLPNIEQLVPSLGNLYLSTKEDGTLYVVNPSSDQQVSDFMEQAKNDSNVQELIAKTNSEYQAVLDSNSDLQAMIAKMKQPETELDIPDASSVDTDVSTSVTVTGDLNVRADSRADSDLVGVLIPGQTVTRLAVLDNGWSKIRFDDGAGTVVEGYVLSEYLQADGEASASSDAGTGSDQQ